MPSLQTRVRIFLLVVSFSILGLLLYFSDAGKVASVVSVANPFYVLIAFLISVSLMLVRAFRWNMLLRRIGVHISLTKLMPTYLSGLFVSNLTPAKIGEPVRSYFLKKTSGASISKSLPSILMERMSDVFVTITLSFAGIVMVTLPLRIEMVLFVVAAAYLIGVATLLYVCSKKSRIYVFSKNLLKFFGWMPFIKRFDKHMEHFAEKFNESIAKYKEVSIISKTMVLSFVIWFSEGVILYLCFLSVGMEVDMLMAVSFLSLSILVGIISPLPGGIGSSEVVLVLLFTLVYPIPIHAVTAAVFMEKFFSTWINIIAGSLCMGSINIKQPGR